MRGLVYSKKLARRYSKLGERYATPDRNLLALLPRVDNKTILDLGCGDGKYSIRLLAKGAKTVTGVDPSREMIALAEKQSAELGNEIAFIKAGVERLPFKENHFDLVFCRFAVHYFKDGKLAFREIYRVLKKRGKLLAIFNCFHYQGAFRNRSIPMQLGNGKDKTNVRIYGKTPEEIKNALSESGLKIIRFKRISNPDAHVSPKFPAKRKLEMLTILLLAQK